MDRVGDYRLRRRLAVGGMGEVYLGEKIGPEGFVKPVVLKCVLPQLAKDKAFVQLFLDEARLAALLNHPNIAQVYDFGITDNIYYMAMEYVPGYTVDDIRRKHKSIDKFMPIEHIALIAAQASQGLHYAHALTDASNVSLGLVHRDVSPHNLIVSVEGTVKIVDFGIAKARAGLTRVTAKGAVGKFGYMSPEQSRGEVVDPRTDLFSLGVCLWELTTNTRLHDAKLERAPAYHREIPPVSTLRRDVPKQFERLLQTAMSVDPTQRFANAQEMHLESERFLAAMTHYAGQSSLAKYIKDLVEGRIENPEQATTGSMVSPASGGSKSEAPKATGGMEAAQKYEEVFGISHESSDNANRPAQGLKPVPASWQTQPKKPQAPEPVSAPVAPQTYSSPPSYRDPGGGYGGVPAPNPSAFGGTPIELEEGSSGALELDLGDHSGGVHRNPAAPRSLPAASKPPSRRKMATPTRPRSGSRWPMLAVVLLLIIAAGGTAAVLFTDQLTAYVEQLLPKAGDQGATAEMTGDYRMVTVPPGATLLIDGSRQEGVTPLTVSLIPGVDHQLELRVEGRATRRLSFKATSHRGVEERTFRLEDAGTLRVESEPSGASVWIDGFEVPGVETPATLTDVPAGREVRLQLTHEGKPKLTRNIHLAVGGKETVKLEFPLR